MSANDPTCARCRCAMEIGFLQDLGHGNVVTQTKWIEGKPEKAYWLGFIPVGMKSQGQERLSVEAWRCPRCTLIELRAS